MPGRLVAGIGVGGECAQRNVDQMMVQSDQADGVVERQQLEPPMPGIGPAPAGAASRRRAPPSSCRRRLCSVAMVILIRQGAAQPGGEVRALIPCAAERRRAGVGPG